MASIYPYAVLAMLKGETVPIQAKKKTCTYNIHVTSAKNNIILGVGGTVVGKTYDITLLREDLLPFGRRYEKIHDEGTLKDEKFTVYMNLEYCGIKKDLLEVDIILMHTKAKEEQGRKKDSKADRETKDLQQKDR